MFRLSLVHFACALVLPATLHGQITVAGSTVHEFTAAPGSVHGGSVSLVNPTDRVQRARVYATDYLYFADGTSRFDPPGTLARSNAAWVQLAAQEVVLPPGGTAAVAYSIQVPRSDTLSGSFWSLLMVESVEGGASGGQPGRPGVGIKPTVRYGIQVVSHVEETGTRKMSLVSGALAASDSGAALDLEIANVGSRATRFDVTTEIYDAEGVARGRFQQSRGLTYPGTSLMHRVELGRLPAGTYRAVVVIDAGDGALAGAHYTLRI